MKAPARAMSEMAYDAAAHKYRLREINTISSAIENIIRKIYNPIHGRYRGKAPLLSH
jgi:hypothetical protein